MARKTVEKTIGTTRMRCTQFGALLGGEFIFRMGMPLLALVGATLGKKAGGLSADAIKVLTTSLKPEDFNWALGHFRDCCQMAVVDVNGAPHPRTGQRLTTWQPLEVMYDDHFAGNYADWMEWLQWVAEVQFGGFFGAPAQPAAAAAEGPASSGSSSPPTASGTTGESSPAPG